MYVCSIIFLVIRGGYRDLIKRLSQIVTIQKKIAPASLSIPKHFINKN